MNDTAIFNLYPTVVSVEGGKIARDIHGNKVEIDQALVDAWVDSNAYKSKRASEYPPITDYLDGVVKGDQAQIDKYIADCLAVKDKYPKA
jgi:hypothetical protein